MIAYPTKGTETSQTAHPAARAEETCAVKLISAFCLQHLLSDSEDQGRDGRNGNTPKYVNRVQQEVFESWARRGARGSSSG